MTSLGLAAFVGMTGLHAGPVFFKAVAEVGAGLLLGGMVVTLMPPIVGLFVGRYILRMNPILVLGALAGAQTMTAAMAAVRSARGARWRCSDIRLPFPSGTSSSHDVGIHHRQRHRNLSRRPLDPEPADPGHGQGLGKNWKGQTAMMKELLLELGTLFAIINPYGLAFVFLNRTMSLSEGERATVARQVAIYAFFVLGLVSGFAGTMILGFFGVSIPALRIAGGLVVAVAGWNLLNESPHEDAGKASATGSLQDVRRQAFFPLTVPLTTGPGTIATAITLAASHQDLQGLALPQLRTVIVAAIVAATIYHAYARVARIARIVGEEGTSVIMRLSAFLLLCVGVQIMITGVTGVLGPLLPAR